MYFNHAFRKSFLPKPTTGAISLVTTGNTAALTTGQIGFFDTSWNALNASTAKPFYFVQGSYFTKDKISPYIGGYQESVKSKMINPKYITRLIRVNAATAANQVQDLCICNTECGKNYNLRLDVKGSPALRFLDHNIYKTYSAYTGCCTEDCSATCTGALTDPTKVAINWALQIINDPYMGQFIMPTKIVDWDGNTVGTLPIPYTAAQLATFVSDITTYLETDTSFDPTAAGAATEQGCLTVSSAYADTFWQSCTFTPTDFYELMPLFTYATLVDYSGDPCVNQCFTVTTVTAPAQASGYGETILRELILDGRYLQEYYPDSMRVESLRMREIEANPALATVNRQGLYDQLLILHSVPRFNNPTGTFDNDQYLVKIHVPTGTTGLSGGAGDTGSIANFILASAVDAGNNDLVLEVY